MNEKLADHFPEDRSLCIKIQFAIRQRTGRSTAWQVGGLCAVGKVHRLLRGQTRSIRFDTMATFLLVSG